MSTGEEKKSPGFDPDVIRSGVQNCAQYAVQFDRNGDRSAALYYYEETLKLLDLLDGQEELDHESQKSSYLARAKALREELIKQEELEENKKKKSALRSADLERAHFMLSQGLDDDEKGNLEEAVEHYGQAVELCLKARKETQDKELQNKLTKLATQALDRAESIKESGIAETLGNCPAPPTFLESLSLEEEENQADPPPPKSATPPRTPSKSAPPLGGGGGGYTEEEKKVLARTSLINGREYVPFLSVDLREKFAFPVPFTDRHGKLTLAPKQKNKLVKWVRPEEYMSQPTVLLMVDCYSVKQTVVSDCSFVASIAISAQYEKRFGKRLITSLIYPQNRKGDPIYNPCGKYMVKLRINGVPRKVVIDDYFPLGPRGEPLCSYSTNKNELWISLLEKAYMKVMGGYDFPGSNSNIDLHALTGWIPERVSIKPQEQAFDKDGVFKKLVRRFHQGDVLVTLATGEMSEAAADRAGLVPTHAYAMLDIREIKGLRLFKLKNPWSHLRWKGNYSELDAIHWNPELQKALDYDPKNARNFDNGVFWIDYDSLCTFYDVIYMNWNPALFKHTYAIHQGWNAGLGPTKDMINISQNPQYSLELTGSGNGALWILLSRHILDIEDFKNNKEYITVLVYKNNGKRVYYPNDPPPYIDGVRINSPHYLCQTVVNESTPRKLNLVVSQYEKSTTIYYTLRVYSTLPFVLKKITDPYKYTQKVTDQWKGSKAGGCANYSSSYPNNPRYQFTVDRDAHILVELKGPRDYQIGFDLKSVVVSNRDSPLYFKNKSCGVYRPGFIVSALEVTAGTYDVIPTTFKPGQESPFFLAVQSSEPLKLAKMM